MTLIDFLAQAGFWQWIGMIFLAGCVAHGFGNFRLWTTVHKHYHGEKREDPL
ncbi:MAG: hypothetical protein RLZZ127_1217 [Planctomycetota bacterium]|jgi:hypothetical protein